MNRLMKELRDRGIIYEADELRVMYGGPEEDVDTHLVDITDRVIIVAWYSDIMPSRFLLYDRFTLKPIASQEMWLDTNPPFFGNGKKNPWDIEIEHDEDEWTKEDAEAADWCFSEANVNSPDLWMEGDI